MRVNRDSHPALWKMIEGRDVLNPQHMDGFDVEEEAVNKFKLEFDRTMQHLSEEERKAVAVYAALTHPSTTQRPKMTINVERPVQQQLHPALREEIIQWSRFRRIILFVAAIIILLLILAIVSKAEPQPHMTVIQAHDADGNFIHLILRPDILAQVGPASSLIVQFQQSGTPIGTYPAFLIINCSTNLTCTSSGVTVTISASGSIGTSFSSVSAGTNTANLLMGNGGTLGVTGTGTISATGLVGSATYKRIVANQGTALSSTDFSLSAGWGTTASITSVSGQDSATYLTISSTGTGQASGPTLTQTFHDGAWSNPPECISRQTGGTGIVSDWTVSSRSTTKYVWTYNSIPCAGCTYELSVMCDGL
jgi:hypothetical protein